MPQTISDVRSFLDDFHASIVQSPVIAEASASDDMFVCRAAGMADSIQYRVSVEEGRVWVSLVTKDRWMSESIEADLMNSGDKLEELIEDEQADLGASGMPISFEHFRSDDLLFTFRSSVESSGAGTAEIIERTGQMLHAYIACFAQLGDVSDDEGDG